MLYNWYSEADFWSFFEVDIPIFLCLLLSQNYILTAVMQINS